MKLRRWTILLIAFTGWAAASTTGTRAETPEALCSRVGTTDTARPIPQDLVPAVNAVFAMHMPARVAVDTTVYRCAQGPRHGLHGRCQSAMRQGKQ